MDKQSLITRPATRDKYINHLENHILPRWRDVHCAIFVRRKFSTRFSRSVHPGTPWLTVPDVIERDCAQGPGMGDLSGQLLQSDAPRGETR